MIACNDTLGPGGSGGTKGAGGGGKSNTGSGGTLDTGAGGEAAAHAGGAGATPPDCDDSCLYANDGECDEPYLCEYSFVDGQLQLEQLSDCSGEACHSCFEPG